MKSRFGAWLACMAGVVALAGCGGNGGGGTQNSNPVVTLSATSAFFGANFGLAFNVTPDDINVTNSGTGTLNFTAVSDSPWLMVTPATVVLGWTVNTRWSDAAGVMLKPFELAIPRMPSVEVSV